MRSRASTSAGFTLIELLVALTLLALMSVALFGGLRFGSRVWEAGDARAERLAEVGAVQDFLRRQLAQVVVPAQQAGTDAETVGSLIGETDALRFTALVPAHIGVGGLYRFDLALVDDAEGRRLELAWVLYRPDDERPFDGELETGGRRTLLSGIEDIAFDYFGATEASRDPDWRGSWEDETQLPNLIRVDVTFPEGDPRRWPELVVAPRLSGSRRR